MKGIATLSKGYLPPKLFPPSFLREISERIALELHKDHHSYKLAFPHESTYYDMKLATFSLDKYFNLIVTFPIFIVPYNHQPLSLYEIETVPIPIKDQDQEASSFSELMVQKPYFVASDSSYIQLRNPKLFHCKKVQEEYFCEETFMVKHTHHHTCESALFYNRSVDLIASQSPFQFYHNRSVTQSVLDGGSQLVLANVKVGHSPTCDPQCLHTLPASTYTLTSREILCNCTLQSDLLISLWILEPVMPLPLKYILKRDQIFHSAPFSKTCWPMTHPPLFHQNRTHHSIHLQQPLIFLSISRSPTIPLVPFIPSETSTPGLLTTFLPFRPLARDMFSPEIMREG